jgi:hypothetical protein
MRTVVTITIQVKILVNVAGVDGATLCLDHVS